MFIDPFVASSPEKYKNLFKKWMHTKLAPQCFLASDTVADTRQGIYHIIVVLLKGDKLFT